MSLDVLSDFNIAVVLFVFPFSQTSSFLQFYEFLTNFRHICMQYDCSGNFN